MDSEVEARSIADLADIMYLIVSYLDPERPHLRYDASKSARRSLARLARTHRNFTEPALKILWRRLPDDEPLADLLCALGIAERHCTPDSLADSAVDFSYTLCGPDDPSVHPNWRRFKEYAAYVRAIAGLFAFDGPKRLELWEDLGRCIAPAPLLPRLQAVSFREDMTQRKIAAGTFYLLSSSVTSLEYGGREYYNPAIRFALVRAFDSAEEIERIRIPMQPWEGMHTLCNRVVHVEVIPEIESRNLQYLAKFQHLRSLSLSLRAIDREDGMLTYPRLETLDLKGHWADHTALLNIVHAPNLRTLSLEVLQRGASSQTFAKYTSECLNAVSTRCPSLPGLVVYMNPGLPTPLMYSVRSGYRMLQSTFPVSLVSVVGPLLALHALRTLTLVLPDYIDISCSSGDLRAMSEAWPGLEALHIQLWDYFTLKGRPHHPGAGAGPRGGPLAALVHFARNCPRLRTLHLPPMDATRLLEAAVLDGATPLSGRGGHGLQSLVVPKLKLEAEAGRDYYASRAQLAERVAECVKDAFPAAAWPFRKEGVQVALEDEWLVVRDNACCLDCDDRQLSAQKF